MEFICVVNALAKRRVMFLRKRLVNRWQNSEEDEDMAKSIGDRGRVWQMIELKVCF